MTKKFIDKVIAERIVDTKQFRYAAIEKRDATKQWIEIQRLPIELIGLTSALDNWDTVITIE